MSNQYQYLSCPRCGGTSINVQVFQEQAGATTVSRTKSKWKEKGHGCLWWLLIGWWWIFIDIMLWICFFPIRLLIQVFKKKKYVGTSNTVTQTANQTIYKSLCTCQGCGYVWENSRT